MPEKQRIPNDERARGDDIVHRSSFIVHRSVKTMPKVAAEIPNELSRQIDRIIRDGWYPDQETVVLEALSQFVDAKSFLGDSPRMLHRFAADSLNDSKPEVALKFVNRALSLLSTETLTDFTL